MSSPPPQPGSPAPLQPRRDLPPEPPPLDPGSLDPDESPRVAPVRRPRRSDEAGITPDGRLRSGSLAGLSLTAAVWALAWPVLVDSLLNSLVGLTDTVLAAGISEAATDAVGNAAYMMWFMGLVIIALDVGATALVSRSIGGGRFAVANAAVGQTMLMALAAGLFLGLLTWFATPFVGTLMGMEPPAQEAFRSYMSIMAFDVPCMCVLYAGIACLRGAGDTFGPMRVMIIVNIVNMIVSWGLAGIDLKHTYIEAGQPVTRILFENPSPFKLGIEGIALGTFTAHGVGAAIILISLIRGRAGLRLLRHRFLKPHWHTLRRIIRVGLPNFLETLGMWFGNFLVILIVGWLGAGLVGAHFVAIRIEAFSFQPGFALAIASATLAGQYLGAGSPRLARRAVLICTAGASLIMGLMGVLFMTMPRTLVGLLSSQPTHLEVTPDLLFITGMVQIPFAISIVFRQAMRGAGDVKVVMWITWITVYALRLPFAYAISGADVPVPEWLASSLGRLAEPNGSGGFIIPNPFPWDLGLRGLWIGLCLEILVRCALFAARFIQGGWTRARV